MTSDWDLSAAQLLALQQLSSPALPIGGFSYSQGLEAAIELQLVHDEASARRWISAQLHAMIADTEAPIWCLLFHAWRQDDMAALTYWNCWFLASRETQELRDETLQMGDSLARLALELRWGSEAMRAQLEGFAARTLPLAHSLVCADWQLPEQAGLLAYLYAWVENQVTAALKAVPLGQLAAQRSVQALRLQLPAVADEALRRSRTAPPDLMTFSPQYGIVAARHESQFSRMFRS